MIVNEKYVLKSCSSVEFQPLISEQFDNAFQGLLSVSPKKFLENSQQEKIDALNASFENVKSKRFILLDGEKCIGWHFGNQEDNQTYYMKNSAIIPEYQNRGLYSSMLKLILDELVLDGYQVVRSLHHITNNRAIVPKLKQGFVICGLQISDTLGTLVELKWFKNQNRRSLMNFRCGKEMPNAEVLYVLRICKK
jgi:RimJ/RimL family protein N-acetyltransferase